MDNKSTINIPSNKNGVFNSIKHLMELDNGYGVFDLSLHPEEFDEKKDIGLCYNLSTLLENAYKYKSMSNVTDLNDSCKSSNNEEYKLENNEKYEIERTDLNDSYKSSNNEEYESENNKEYEIEIEACECIQEEVNDAIKKWKKEGKPEFK